MNILKSSDLIESGNYQKIYYHFGFDNIWKSIFNGIKQYRFFDISFPDENHISFKPRIDYFYLANMNKLSKLINEEEKITLMGLTETKTFNVKYKKKILCYLHLDWIIALEHIKEDSQSNEKLIEYLQFETLRNDIVKKIKHISNNAENRSNIYTINKNSVIVDMLNMKESKNLSKLAIKNKSLILKNKLINFIEISSGFDNQKLTAFLLMFNESCNKIIKNNEVTESMKFSLKIRKIKRTYKKGMYIANQNTIMLDPRHVDSFVHELGHWYHTFFKPEIVTEKQAEEFAENFII